MTTLQIHFFTHAELTPGLHNEINALDRIAFAGESHDDDPELSGINWATPDWMGLGFLDGELITQLCLPKREIRVGAEMISVAGIGGMATHPKYQHKGYGSALLAATEAFMRDEIQVPFGLLICANGTRGFYKRAGWYFAAEVLFFSQDNQRRALHTSVMILPLANQRWSTGEIDLCGLPW